jgi:hypothetical protein
MYCLCVNVYCTAATGWLLFVCKCVLYCCHRVATQLQFTNISYCTPFCYVMTVCFVCIGIAVSIKIADPRWPCGLTRWSAVGRTDINATYKHNKHKRWTFMPSAGFESAIPVITRAQQRHTCADDMCCCCLKYLPLRGKANRE